MSEGYGKGQQDGDWVTDIAPEHGCVCSECGDIVIEDMTYFQQLDRTLCVDCACMVLNAREDYISDLEAENASGEAVKKQLEINNE